MGPVSYTHLDVYKRQAWKKATRTDFKDHLDADQLALRTKRAVDQITRRLTTTHALEQEAATARAVEVLTVLGFTLEKGRAKKGEEASAEANLTEYLTFFSNSQLDRFAEIVAQAEPGAKLDKRALMEAAQTHHGVEVAPVSYTHLDVYKRQTLTLAAHPRLRGEDRASSLGA